MIHSPPDHRYGDVVPSYYIINLHGSPLSVFDPKATGNQLEFHRYRCLSFYTAPHAQETLDRILSECSPAMRDKAIRLRVSTGARGWHNVPNDYDPRVLITMDDVRSFISTSIRKERCVNFLGWLENRDLAPNVMALFTTVSPSGASWYNWVSGNDRMRSLVFDLIDAYLIKHPESDTLDFRFMHQYYHRKEAP